LNVINDGMQHLNNIGNKFGIIENENTKFGLRKQSVIEANFYLFKLFKKNNENKNKNSNN